MSEGKYYYLSRIEAFFVGVLIGCVIDGIVYGVLFYSHR